MDDMFSMLEMAYADGIRAICLTPHYSPYLFGDTSATSAKSFAQLAEYVSKKHPDMRLFLGHELGYHHSGLDALNDGHCRSLNGGRYVLVDFPESVEFYAIRNAMDQLQCAGYFPVLAHTERYRALHAQLGWIAEFVAGGGIVQINASSVNLGWTNATCKQWKRLVRKGLAHVISTDAHNLTVRPPRMSVCLPYLRKHCDGDYIRALLWENACRIVQDELL